MLSTFTLAIVTGLLAIELMLQLHNKGNKVTTYSKATQFYSVNGLTFSWFVAEPRRFVTELDLLFRHWASPALHWPKLRRQWSVKCFAQTGAFPETIPLTHCFFRGLDEGIQKQTCVDFYIQTLSNCEARLRAMMSLKGRMWHATHTIVAHFLMGGRDRISGRAKQRKGR